MNPFCFVFFQARAKQAHESLLHLNYKGQDLKLVSIFRTLTYKRNVSIYVDLRLS